MLCDKLLMTADSELYLAGPALVKAATGQSVDAAEVGGAAMHAKVSGTIDFLEPNDLACLEKLRSLVDLLPADATPHEQFPSPVRAADDLFDLVGADGRKPYDIRDVLACIVDAGSLIEYKADYGKTLVCAYASIAGRKVGIVANQRHPTKSARGELQLGGVIYHDSADKAARFVMDCNQTALPLIFFQDVKASWSAKTPNKPASSAAAPNW